MSLPFGIFGKLGVGRRRSCAGSNHNTREHARLRPFEPTTYTPRRSSVCCKSNALSQRITTCHGRVTCHIWSANLWTLWVWYAFGAHAVFRAGCNRAVVPKLGTRDGHRHPWCLSYLAVTGGLVGVVRGKRISLVPKEE